jgi:hypothetical protein
MAEVEGSNALLYATDAEIQQPRVFVKIASDSAIEKDTRWDHGERGKVCYPVMLLPYFRTEGSRGSDACASRARDIRRPSFCRACSESATVGLGKKLLEGGTQPLVKPEERSRLTGGKFSSGPAGTN